MQLSKSTYDLLVLSQIKKYKSKKKFNDLRKYYSATELSIDAFLENENISLNELKTDLNKATIAANTILEKLITENISLISYFDKDYPSILTTIEDAPLLLTYKGNISNLSKHISFSIIGTRNPSSYGYTTALRTARFLTTMGINIVSGLAIGCDTAAHIGAIENNGTTTAILGTSLNKIYPASNSYLVDKILATDGCIISEYLFTDSIFPTNFIYRDRIQAALSLLTLLIESPIQGGSMHTINFASKYKRAIAAIYPPATEVTSNNYGNIDLIERKIASKLQNAKDFIEILSRLITNLYSSEILYPILSDYIDSLDTVSKNIVTHFNSSQYESDF
jgi:DNA processing protein